MKLEKMTFIEKYIDYCIKMENAMEKNDYRTNNKYAKKLIDLNKKYKNEEYYAMALNELIDNESLKVCAAASADSLRSNVNISKAMKKLTDISTRKNIEIVGLGAEMALEIWNKDGAKGLIPY